MSESKSSSLAYKIYSVFAIVIFGSGYILANYFPQYAEKIGLGWLNSHKTVQVETPAWLCHLKWDWGAGTAALAARVDYEVSCKAKVNLKLEDAYIYISETNTYRPKSGPQSQSSTNQGSKHLSQSGPIALQAGMTFQDKGTLGILRLSSDKHSNTARKLILNARVNYEQPVPTFPKNSDPHQLFVATGVY